MDMNMNMDMDMGGVFFKAMTQGSDSTIFQQGVCLYTQFYVHIHTEEHIFNIPLRFDTQLSYKRKVSKE